MEDLSLNKRTGRKKENIEKKIAEIVEKQARLTKLFMDGKITEQAFNMTNDGYSRDIQQLREKEENDRNDERTAFLQEWLKRAIAFEDAELNEELFGTLVEKIIVFQNHILDFHIIGLTSPIRLQWETNGRRQENFGVQFTVIPISES